MLNKRFEVKKNIANAVVAFAINIALVFFSYRLVIASGGLAALGLWSTLTAWIYVLRIGDAGMSSASTRFVAVRDVNTEAHIIRRYIDTGILFNTALFAILALAGCLAVQENIAFLLHDIKIGYSSNLIPLMFIGFVLSNLAALILGALQGLHAGYVGAQISVAGGVAQLVVVYILVPVHGLVGLAWGVIVQNLVIFAMGWGAIVKRTEGIGPFPSSWSTSTFREMLDFSFRVQAVNLANGLFEPLSKILLSRFGGLEAQGIFELAYKTVTLPRNAIMSAAQATLPATANLLQNDPEAAKVLYKRVLKLVIYSSLVVLVGVTSSAPLVSFLWLKHVDYVYWSVVLCLAIGYAGNACGAPAYNLGIASGFVKNNLKSACFTLALLVGVGGILGYVCGVYGVAFSVGLSLAFGGVYIKMKNEAAFFAGK